MPNEKIGTGTGIYFHWNTFSIFNCSHLPSSSVLYVSLLFHVICDGDKDFSENAFH